MKWQFQSCIDKIKWHIRQTTSTSVQLKKGNVRKRHSTKWDRMWELNGQWQITFFSVCITPQGHSLFPWVYNSIYPSLWPTYAMIILIEWRIPDLDRSGILSTFPTYIGETVIWGFIWTYVLNFVPWLLSSSPLARLNTNCFLASKSYWIISPVLSNCVR